MINDEKFLEEMTALSANYKFALKSSHLEGKHDAREMIEERFKQMGLKAELHGKWLALEYFESVYHYPQLVAGEDQNALDELLEQAQVEDYTLISGRIATLYSEIAVLSGILIQPEPESDLQQEFDFFAESCMDRIGEAKLKRTLTTATPDNKDGRYHELEHYVILTPSEHGDIILTQDTARQLYDLLKVADEETAGKFKIQPS